MPVPVLEIGRELKVSDLTLQSVVVVKPPNGPYLTLWVESVSPQLVVFYSGTLKWSILNFVTPDGTLQDDHGRQVRVFEYLGKV